ncbi:hypothetical protein P691DRAFT_769711 [Macrolepiota fuliginosa MF-IS2]|uniref:Uncharacterized protein n=1 Tax=Macrolepiota fuliginosa MF-IS2 TaxID=1400762 RepID=A0A9P5WY40_9AGAR|nr:hypothetical protein P691DRAFT_769711 [Macrolepiota fuliginosa MF-IS2]
MYQKNDGMNMVELFQPLVVLYHYLPLLCSKLTHFKPLKRLARDKLCLQYYLQLSPKGSHSTLAETDSEYSMNA